MKKLMGMLLIASILLAMNAWFDAEALAEGVNLVLPDELRVVEQEAFRGNTSIRSVMIMNKVSEIQSNAFADCTNLQEVYLGNNPDISIADDAFSGCGRLSFYVYPGTAGEKYARVHGYICNLLTAGSSSLEKTMSLVAKVGKPNIAFQDGSGRDISSMRVIVRRTVNYLPDLSDLNPTDIIAKYNIENDTYIIQFSSIEDTKEAMRRLESDHLSAYVEPDRWSELDLVSGAAIVRGWSDPDPMGFEAYAPYVAARGNGRAIIAIVDSGVQVRSYYSSMLLQSEGLNVLEDYDGQSWTSDALNHGSAIASIIKSCVGTANVKILPIRVYSGSGAYDDALIAEGIDYAVNSGANFINLSFTLSRSGVVTDAINRASNKGCTVVVAAGNQNRNISNVFPANLPSVVTVAGLDSTYELYVDSTDAKIGSNFGSGIDYCAPYCDIIDASTGGSMRGTSFSAPLITSALALNRLDTTHTIEDLRESCALQNDPNSFGYGMPQLKKLTQIAPDKITLTTSLPDKMKVGDSIPLAWIITPENTTNKAVSWISSNSNVLRCVSNTNGGLSLQAYGKGTAHVTLTVNESTASVTTKDIVVEQPVTGITISGEPTKLIVGKTVTLSAMVSPGNATNDKYTWHSANSCASVDQKGVVTGQSAGIATIYATANDGYGVESNRLSIPVVVQPDATAVDVFINGSSVKNTTVKMNPENTKTLTFTVSPSEAEQLVSYESLDTSIATISDNGVITAKSVGTTNILAIASTGSNIKATVTIKVENPVVDVTGLILKASSSTIDVGSTSTVTWTISPNNATDKTLTWSSSNPSVATVDNGIVTGNGIGTATITGNGIGTATITATTHNSISKAVTITVRQPYTLYFNANGGDSDEDSRTVYSGEAVGTLPDAERDGYEFDGWYTTRTGGTKVTRSTKFDCSTSKTIYAHWTEIEIAPTSIKLDTTYKKVYLELDETTFYLTATVKPVDADDTVTWTSSNESVATVSTSGKVTVKWVEGSATITAKTVNELTATCTIDVEKMYHPTISITATSSTSISQSQPTYVWFDVDITDINKYTISLISPNGTKYAFQTWYYYENGIPASKNITFDSSITTGLNVRFPAGCGSGIWTIQAVGTIGSSTSNTAELYVYVSP